MATKTRFLNSFINFAFSEYFTTVDLTWPQKLAFLTLL